MKARGDDYGCGACSAAVPDHVLRASREYPDGECVCPGCGARIARQPASERSLAVRAALISAFIGATTYLAVNDELAEGHVMRYVLIVAIAAALAMAARAHRAKRVLRPIDGILPR